MRRLIPFLILLITAQTAWSMGGNTDPEIAKDTGTLCCASSQGGIICVEDGGGAACNATCFAALLDDLPKVRFSLPTISGVGTYTARRFDTPKPEDPPPRLHPAL